MAPTTPLPIRLAQTAAILLSASLAGASISLSAVIVPRLLELPTPLMLLSWRATYHQGSRTMPPAAVVNAALWVYLAAQRRSGAYLAAGALSFGIIPYTVVFMMGTNRMLEARAGSVDKRGEVVAAEEERAGSKALVDRWGVLNLGRTVMVGVAAVVGALSTI